jgi:hypothetical protein
MKSTKTVTAKKDDENNIERIKRLEKAISKVLL